jgi:hypothetical protein
MDREINYKMIRLISYDILVCSMSRGSTADTCTCISQSMFTLSQAFTIFLSDNKQNSLTLISF